MSKVKIFVSYAHADFQFYAQFKASRISCILDDILHDLHCHDVRAPFAILMDRRGLIVPTYVIDERIDQAVAECDIGLILLSRSYCASEECRAEFRKLLEQNKYLSIVETENSWTEDFASEMRQVRPDVARIYREPFYGGPPGDFKPFAYPLPLACSPEELRPYYDAIYRVASGIEKRSQEILAGKRNSEGLTGEEVPPHRVFLADPTPDVKDEVASLAAALQKAELSILCFNPRLHVAPGASVSAAIKSAIANCDVVFQVLGHIPGGQADGRPLAPLQYEIAAASGKPFHVWSPVLDPNECRPDYAEFLKSIHYHQNSFEEFEQYAVKQATEAIRAAAVPPHPAGTPPYVTIDVAKPDLPVAFLLIEAIQQRADVSQLDFEIERTQLEDAVSNNDGIVLVCADSREGQQRINAHFPIIRKVKQRSGMLDIAIGDGIRSTSGAELPPYPRGPSVHVVRIDRQQMKVDPASLDEFLTKAQANADRRTV